MKSLSHIYLGSLYITLAVLEGVARADQWHSAPGSRGLASETLRPPASTTPAHLRINIQASDMKAMFDEASTLHFHTWRLPL